MARVPITVYLLPEQLAGIERRAAQVGKQRSAWVADTLVRALDDELLPLDEILLDQLTKLRAGLETMVEAQAGRGPDAKARLTDLRQRSRDLAARMQAEARERLRRCMSRCAGASTCRPRPMPGSTPRRADVA